MTVKKEKQSGRKQKIIHEMTEYWIKKTLKSSIQEPASSIGLIPAPEFEPKLDSKFKILVYKDT